MPDRKNTAALQKPETSPTKRFTFHATTPPEPMLRERDNGKPKTPKPSWATKPAPNLAPPGCVGIRRNLAKSTPDFDL